MSDINDWTSPLEKTLNEWKNKCILYARAHALAKEGYERMFTYTIIPVICMSISCSIFSTISAVFTTNPTFSIVSAVCGALSTGLSFWIQNKNPTEIAAKHEKLAQSYRNISLTIETELAQAAENRVPGHRFLDAISSRMSSLAEGGLPEDIWKDVKEKYDETLDPDVIVTVEDKVDVPGYEFRMDGTNNMSPDMVNKMTDMQLERMRGGASSNSPQKN